MQLHLLPYRSPDLSSCRDQLLPNTKGLHTLTLSSGMFTSMPQDSDLSELFHDQVRGAAHNHQWPAPPPPAAEPLPACGPRPKPGEVKGKHTE